MCESGQVQVCCHPLNLAARLVVISHHFPLQKLSKSVVDASICIFRELLAVESNICSKAYITVEDTVPRFWQATYYANTQQLLVQAQQEGQMHRLQWY